MKLWEIIETGWRSRQQEALLADNQQRLDFAIRVAGVELDEWQRDVIRSKSKRVLLNCARQLGKSTVAAIVAAHTAVYSPGSLSLVTSPTLRQSGEFYAKVRAILAAARVSLAEDNKTSCTTETGSRVVSLPGTQATIRGFSAPTLAIIDEAAFTEDSLYDAILPMLNVSAGALWLLSTPYGKRGVFHREWTTGKGWFARKATVYDCPRISAETVEKARASMPAGKFRQEFECEFVETSDQVFSEETIAKSFGDVVELAL